eukprot:TRINITY_DN2550_c0_g6_i1.p1 TRINITY_DN2550_c0_g6~~TRINITY_DN2550_c0_g6_i1.p1  ORF type:complete len:963 (+),score=164.66 TRINITY_DN2550_c0_g6_i1:1544-4432(+)
MLPVGQQQRRKLIEWSPHNPENFVVGSNDLRLYDIKFTKQQPSTATTDPSYVADPSYEPSTLNERKTISLVSINAEVQYFRCMAWALKGYTDDPNLIAIGLPGKAVLTSFSTVQRIKKEFVPKNPRACLALAWNPLKPTQLAMGWDRVRGDCSTLVWDINSLQNSSVIQTPAFSSDNRLDSPHKIVQTAENIFNVSPLGTVETVSTAMAELTGSEAVISLAWVPQSDSCLAVGTNLRWLRIYDLRGNLSNPRSVVAHGKAVSGVCFDSFNPYRLATFSEEPNVRIWDTRKLVEPTHIIQTGNKNENVQQIDWCPTRSGILGTISKEHNAIKIWDLKDCSTDSTKSRSESVPLTTSITTTITTTISGKKSEELQQTITLTKPNKTFFTSDHVSSFSWHPSNECRMISITYSGNVEVISLNESIPITWSPLGDVSFSYGTKVVQFPLVDSKPDISTVMRERATQGYSAIIEENRRMSYTFNDETLVNLWEWMTTMCNLSKRKISLSSSTATTQPVNDFPGVSSILFEKDNSFSGISLSIESGIEKTGIFVLHKSPQRSLCLQICGWAPKSSLDVTLSRLEKEGEHEKAAAMAVFYLDTVRAIQILNKYISLGNTNNGNNNNNNNFSHLTISMALASFGENLSMGGNILKEQVRTMIRNTPSLHPYLRACMEFLCSDYRDLDQVIESLNISLHDKIALGCKYLGDKELYSFIERLSASCIESGKLEGLILTGLNSKGVELLQHYVDKLGDVQTACLIMIHVVPLVFKDHRVSRWLSIYREMLDLWKLWYERALLDVNRKTAEITPPSQIFARCNFCNASLSMSAIAPSKVVSSRVGRFTGSTSQTTPSSSSVQMPIISTKTKISSCPACKKPLPRCSLCLQMLNCSLPTFESNRPISSSMGGESLSNSGQNLESMYWKSGSNDFDNWFTWCQTCRHGGHSKHIFVWFENHTQCPFNYCSCQGASI